MSRLTEEQQAKQAAIQKNAMIWGCVGGAIVALIALWAFGSQGSAVRFGGAAVLGAGAGFGLFKWSSGSGAKSAQCPKCDAEFSISRTDRSEKVLGSEPKESREEAEDRTTKVTTWMEEKYEVTETFTCSKCNDVTTKKHTSTRKKDEKSTVEAAAPLGVAGAMAAGTAASALDMDSDAPKSMKGASAAGGKSDLQSGKSKGGATPTPAADIPAPGAKAMGTTGGATGKSDLKSGASKGGAAAPAAAPARPAGDDERELSGASTGGRTGAGKTGAGKKQEASAAADDPFADNAGDDAAAGGDPFADDDAPEMTPSNKKKKGS